MVVLEGDKVNSYPSKNFIMLKPYSTIYLCMEDNLLINVLWKNLSQIYGSFDITTFIASLGIEKDL